MKVVVMMMVLLLGIQPCWAAETLTVPGLDGLYRQAETVGISPEEDFVQSLANLLAEKLRGLNELLRSGLSTGLKLLAVVLLCSLARSMGGDGTGLQAWELAGALAITALTMTDMESMIGLGRDTIGRMDAFSGAVLPVMAALTAATGHVSSAALRQGATVLFSKVLLTAMDELLIPLVYAYVAVSCAQAVVGDPGLERLAGLLKSTVTFVLTTILLLFVGYLTASGAIAGSVDASRVKAVRLAISRAIPVVGSVLADASESVLIGAGVLKGTVGAVGVLVVLAICLGPFLHLAVQYLVYRVTAALCATVAQPRLARLIDAIGAAFGLVLGMTGAAALLLLVSLVSAVMAVAP